MMQVADVPAARQIACKPFASCWDLYLYYSAYWIIFIFIFVLTLTWLNDAMNSDSFSV